MNITLFHFYIILAHEVFYVSERKTHRISFLINEQLSVNCQWIINDTAKATRVSWVCCCNVMLPIKLLVFFSKYSGFGRRAYGEVKDPPPAAALSYNFWCFVNDARAHFFNSRLTLEHFVNRVETCLSVVRASGRNKNNGIKFIFETSKGSLCTLDSEIYQTKRDEERERESERGGRGHLILYEQIYKTLSIMMKLKSTPPLAPHTTWPFYKHLWNSSSPSSQEYSALINHTHGGLNQDTPNMFLLYIIQC